MKEMYLFKHDGAYFPWDEQSKEVSDSNPNDEPIKMKCTFPRNPLNHKRIFVFFKVTFEIQPHYDNFDMFRKWLIMKSGYCTTAVAPNGTVMFFPDSLRWDSMDEVTFKKVFSACIDAFLVEWGYRITREKLLQVIEFV